MADTLIAIKEDAANRILAIHITLPNTFRNRTSAIAKDIKKLKSRVNRYVKDYVVVTGQGKRGFEDEIMVIVYANQLKQDLIQFSGLKEQIREVIPGSTRNVKFPTDVERDPQKIYHAEGKLGWTVVKAS